MSEVSGLEFRPDGIGHLLSDKPLQVPMHQRSYAWEGEHVQQLFDDLAEAINDSESDDYFLGTIVLVVNGNKRYEIIDGQQRLATVSILIAAIRDYFRSRDAELAQDTTWEFLASRDRRSRLSESRLHLNIEDREFYESHVVALYEHDRDRPKPLPGAPESHRLIAKAYEEATKHVLKIARFGSSDTAPDRLQDWLDFIKQHAKIVAIFVPGEQNAYTLFETLNDRGLALTKSDLIKNHLFGRAASKLDAVQANWRNMMGQIESVTDERIAVRYIRHQWMSERGSVRERDLYKAVRKHLRSQTAVMGYSSAIAKDAVNYAAILNPESPVWQPYGATARDHVRTLRILNIEQIRPLMLAVLRRFNERHVRLALHLFVNWSVRFLISGGGGGGVMERNYSETAQGVSAGTISTVSQLVKQAAKFVPSDGEFEAAFSTASVSKTHLARYYLRALEDHIAGEPHPEKIGNPNPEIVNLEHVLPENPDPAWGVSDNDAMGLHRRLGNMCLLLASENARIGNGLIGSKRKVYVKSAFELTREIADEAEWGRDEIDERQSRLAVLAVKTWPLRVS